MELVVFSHSLTLQLWPSSVHQIVQLVQVKMYALHAQLSQELSITSLFHQVYAFTPVLPIIIITQDNIFVINVIFLALYAQGLPNTA